MIKQLKELQKINKQFLHLKLKIIESNNKKKVEIKELQKKQEFPYVLTITSCVLFSISLAGINIYKYKVLPTLFIGFIGVCIGIFKNYQITNKIQKIKNKKFI